MFKSRVISEDGLSAANGGTTIDIRLPWYRALPLSTVEIAEVKIDGETVAPSDMSFRINGRSFAIAELAARDKEWWYVLDSGYLEIPNRPLEVGGAHDIVVTVGLRPPYIPGFYRLTECKKRLTVRSAAKEAY